jgi:hypothetical protein
VTAAIGITEWRKSSRKWMLPATIALLSVIGTWFAPPSVGRRIADWQFQTHLGDYEDIVERFRLGTIPCPADCSVHSVALKVGRRPPGIVSVRASVCNDKSFIVAFIRATSVPLLHEGYVVSKGKEGSNCSDGALTLQGMCPYVRHVFGDWYHFSDQPGL